jgi:hypothetical protein
VQPTTEIICPGQLELRVVILQADGTKILEDSNSTIVALYSTGASVTNILLSCRKSLRWTPTGGWECWADHKRTMPYENVRVHVLRVL